MQENNIVFFPPSAGKGEKKIQKTQTKMYKAVLAGKHNPPQKRENVQIAIPVSVGRAHCEGEQLRAQLRELNKQFKNCKFIFVKASSLQRFTRQLHGEQVQEAYNNSMQAGMKWQEDHEPMIKEELTQNTYEIIDWEDLIRDTQFPTKYSIVEKLYETEKNKSAFSQTANEFLMEEMKTYGIKNLPKIGEGEALCIAYLKEEDAVHLLLADKNYEYVAYPRQMSQALKVVYENNIIEEGVLQHLIIRVKEIKVDQDQKIEGSQSQDLKKTENSFGNQREIFFKLSAEERRKPVSQDQSPSSSPPKADVPIQAVNIAFMTISFIASQEDVDADLRLKLISGLTQKYAENVKAGGEVTSSLNRAYTKFG